MIHAGEQFWKFGSFWLIPWSLDTFTARNFFRLLLVRLPPGPPLLSLLVAWSDLPSGIAESVTVLEVERSEIANLSSLVIPLVGVKKFPIGLKPGIEACRGFGGVTAAELVLWRPEPPRVNG